MKMVCVKCSTELVPDENGVDVVETFLDPPQPYKLWSADLWKCPCCGFQIITGFGHDGMSHHEGNFEAVLETAQARGHVYYDHEKGVNCG